MVQSVHRKFCQKIYIKKLTVSFFVTALGLTSLPASANSNVPLSIEKAVALASEPNSGLAEMQSRANAAAAIPSQQGALPDPRLHINFMNLPTDSLSLSQEPMTQLQLGFSQALPFPGKLGLREDAASSRANAMQYQVDEFRLRLVRNVKHAWWQLFYLDKSLETVNNNRQLLKQLVSTAQTKYSVGQGLQQDVLLAQLELSKLLDKELNLRAMRQTVSARLNAFMERPSYQAITLLSIDNKVLSTLKKTQELQKNVRTSRPHLQALEADIVAAQKKLKLSKMGVLPDFSVGANYGFRDGKTDMTSIQLSMSLPVYAGKKQIRKTDQRQAELMAAKHALGDSQQTIDADIQAQVARYEQSIKQIDLFEQDIIPQAQQTVESMSAGYQVNKVDFITLIRSQATLYDYETQHWNAFSRAQQAAASLVAAVGQENIYE